MQRSARTRRWSGARQLNGSSPSRSGKTRSSGAPREPEKRRPPGASSPRTGSPCSGPAQPTGLVRPSAWRPKGGTDRDRPRGGGSVAAPEPGGLVQHDRIAGRSGGADDAERRPDERSLQDLLIDEGLGVDVLEVPDAPPGLHLGVARDGEVRSLLARGLSVARRGVAHGHRDVPRGEILARADAEAGLALVEQVAGRLPLVGVHRLVAVVAPAVALAGVKRDAVTRADLLESLHLHDALD